MDAPSRERTGAADVLVIGSGVAGAMVAWKLARDGWRVVVLEAGPRITRGETVERFRKTEKFDLSAPYPNAGHAPRPDFGNPRDDYLRFTGEPVRCEYLRVVGGTTWHWSGATIRWLPVEFAMRSTYGVAEDWPIGYGALEAYYAEAEREMGVNGSGHLDSPRSTPYPMTPLPTTYTEQQVIDRLEPHGFPFAVRPTARNAAYYNGRPVCHGNGTCSPVCPVGAKYDAMVHVEKAEDLGVRVIADALAVRIDADEDGTISSVTVRRPDGSRQKFTARCYVLAANGIETPRLMLASAGDHAPLGIANHHDVVGRYFMDHPGVGARLTLPFPVYPGRGPSNTRACHVERDGGFRRRRAGFTVSVYNRLMANDIAAQLVREGVRPPELDRLIDDRARRMIEFDSHTEMLPQHTNRIRLDDRRVDSAGVPGIVIDYALDRYTLAGLDRARALFRRFSAILGAERSDELPPFSHHHLMGTCRMGRDARSSVVDEDCRAHAHDNLYIAGSSVFPVGGTANPTLTIAALALRLGDHLNHRLRQAS